VVRGELGHPGVVEQGVDPAERLGRRGDLAAVGVLAHVALDQHGLGTLGLTEASGFLGLGLAGGVVDDHHGRAARGGLHRDGPAEARRPPGDQHHETLEILASHASLPEPVWRLIARRGGLVPSGAEV
jgi:hypothetical protein